MLSTLEVALLRVVTFLLWIAGAALVVMLLLIVADVIGIKILDRPVPGGIEMVAFSGVVVIAFALAYTQYTGGHVAVDFVIARFPERPRFFIRAFTTLFSACLLAALTYYSFRYAGQMRAANQVSLTQNIPFYPFIYSMAACFTITLLVIVRDFIKLVAKAVEQWTP